MQPKTWVDISKRALLHNVRSLRAVLKPDTALMAVVKSNAYGHGTPQVVEAIDAKVDWYGVDSITEAEALRSYRTKKPILILGYVPRTDLAQAVRHGFSLTTYTPEAIRILKQCATPTRPARIHLKIETGTSRQGIILSELPKILSLLKNTPVIIEGISTHFANSEEGDGTYTQQQHKTFQEATEILRTHRIVPPYRHSSCSAALFRFPDLQGTMVRAGLCLYGLWPSQETKDATTNTLQPALTWKTRIAQIKSFSKGTPIGYDRTEILSRDARVAVLPVGYWDGFDRALSSKGMVLIHGQYAKILGRICMNMCMVDVTDIPRAAYEDEVILLGTQRHQEVSAETIAKLSDTINYEIVTRINPLLPRQLR